MSDTHGFPSMPMTGKRSALEARRNRRNQKKRRTSSTLSKSTSQTNSIASDQSCRQMEERLTQWLQHCPRDEVLNLVSSINNVYQDKLGRDAPFMSHVVIGMQSTGKSTIVERMLKTALNIVQDGTGTRCPLDITVIHDSSCTTPRCELHGEELEGKVYMDLNVQEAFNHINLHTKRLDDQDRFSTKAIRLVFRASNVQNMRIVDLPGIITNRSKGKMDNRDDITQILRHEMEKENTKLCVLLEPVEYEVNAVVEFCDQVFGGRAEWIGDATFLMTKFDKQMDDTRTGTRANKFFKEFHANGCFPFLVSTPTPNRVDREPARLYKTRMDLLKTADDKEKQRFNNWFAGHNEAREDDPSDEILEPEIEKRIGFSKAEKHLQKAMLKDVIHRLPVVIAELNMEKVEADRELKLVLDKQKLTDPRELKKLSGDFLSKVETLVNGYLDGDLLATINFPNRAKQLDDEIEAEDDSDWTNNSLGHHFTVEEEEDWRNKMFTICQEGYPTIVQPEQKFLGGKQVQRALRFCREMMVRAIPKRDEICNFVANCTGYGTSEKENWERAMLQVVKVCLQQACHPGINYTIRHIGSIWRELFHLALEDAKLRGRDSARFKLLPSAAENFFTLKFEKMVWQVMQHASESGHSLIEPMYDSIDPNLPSEFQGDPLGNESDEDGGAVDSGEATTDLLIKEGVAKAKVKTCLLPEARTSMVTKDETNLILEKSYTYVHALMKITLITLRFHFDKHLLKRFKDQLKEYKGTLMEDAPWEELAQPDPAYEEQKAKVEAKIQSIEDSLREVERLRAKVV